MSINKLYYGTWELDGILKNITEEEAIKLLKYAKSKGIKKFDTAIAYGNGKVERILSNVINESDIVLTKIPAITKPNLDESEIDKYYPKDYIKEKIKESLNNLKLQKIPIVLLHNWSRNWKDLRPLEELQKLKQQNIITGIGISLPNNYNMRLPDNVLNIIDYIEAPYNIENEWILKDIDYYKKHNIKIILRSLFMQGKLIKENKVSIENTLSYVKKLNVYMTIGMTSIEQINKNIYYLGDDYNE